MPWKRRYRLLCSLLPFGRGLLVTLIQASRCVLLAGLQDVSFSSLYGGYGGYLPGSSGSLLLLRLPLPLLFNDPLSKLNRLPFFVNIGLGDLACPLTVFVDC